MRGASEGLRVPALQQPGRLHREGRGVSVPVQPVLEGEEVSKHLTRAATVLSSPPMTVEGRSPACVLEAGVGSDAQTSQRQELLI